jgi:signal transduction histidine kinase
MSDLADGVGGRDTTLGLSTGLDLPTVFEAVSIPTIVLDATGEIVVWNEAEERLVGVERERVTGTDGLIGEELYDAPGSTILAEKVLEHPQRAHEVYEKVVLAEREYSMLVDDSGPVFEDRSTVDASGASVWFIATPVYDGDELAGVIEFTQDRSESERRSTEVDGLVEELSSTLTAYQRGNYTSRAEFDAEETILEDDLVTVIEDVNELGEELQYKEELEESNEQLQQFAYIASHDLQEPLRMVSSYLDLLADEYAGELDAEADEYIDFAVDGAERMQAMIDDLLTYSRVKTRAEPFEPVDAGEILERTLLDLELLLSEADATVTTDDLPTVVADGNQLGQVFQNLIKNAVEHAGVERPSIHVGAERTEDGVVFSVVDDGVGIPADQQEKIFGIFEQSDREDDGTGIGLAVCNRIIERHGGEIRVESAPGEGATFTFEIPDRAAEAR